MNSSVRGYETVFLDWFSWESSIDEDQLLLCHERGLFLALVSFRDLDHTENRTGTFTYPDAQSGPR